jgi:CheY-like chemotaxis protein
MMPSLSGYDVLDNLRSIVELGAAKVIVMSALNQPEDIEKAKSLGADDFIVKSQVTIDDVMGRIHTLMAV